MCEIKINPYSGHIEKLKEPIELKGRVIMYKPVAKLSGKSGAKKGGMNRNPAEGPARENNNNFSAGPAFENGNNPFGKYETIAYIKLRTPDSRFEPRNEYSRKINQLEQIDNDIFYVSINNQSKNNLNGLPEKTTIVIRLNNLSISEAKKKLNFKKELDDLIEILKYFKKNATYKKFDTEFILSNSNEKQFSPKHNEFLTYLHQELEK